MKKNKIIYWLIAIAIIAAIVILFCHLGETQNISVSGNVTAYCPTFRIAEGTFTFNPSEIIPNSEDTKKRCGPVAKSSTTFGENKEIQFNISALKCGPYPLYYSFTIKYYNLNISHIISHKNLKKIKRFRIQLDSAQMDAKLETSLGKFDVIYFEGYLLDK